jgi:gamma-glutamylcyclotransferase (GGCT)/AIG2-like uncharacterized protein YtfP
VANLFVYGTLTDKSRFYQLTGKSFVTFPAILKDFRKLNSDRGYPYIVPEKGAVVKGLLIRNVDRRSMQKLDEYEAEGRLYHREKVRVVSDGEEIGCEAYVGNPTLLRRRT